MKIKQILKIFISLVLCLLIIISSLALITVTVLRTTIFSEKYYLQLLESDAYLLLVKDAIESDVSAQSSYVGIPSEVLLAGFNDNILKAQLHDYLTNSARYLNFEGELIAPAYPPDLFLPALRSFLDSDASANDYNPTEEQYALLEEVAEDTSRIVEKHINIFQLNLFSKATSFRSLQQLIYIFSNMDLYALWALLLVTFCLFIIHLHNIRQFLFYQFTSFWFVGSIVFVPATVLKIFNLVQRLSIDTAYIKYASGILLNTFIDAFLNLGLLFLLLSSMSLVFTEFRKNCKSQVSQLY